MAALNRPIFSEDHVCLSRLLVHALVTTTERYAMLIEPIGSTGICKSRQGQRVFAIKSGNERDKPIVPASSPAYASVSV